jgi:cell division protein FtsN
MKSRHAQRGGFAVGLVIGVLVGLTLALGVALYVTKVPVPFVNKVPQRTPGQDAAEAEKNKNWDPNAPLAGKTPSRPNAVASGSGTMSSPSAAVPAPPGAAPTAAARASAPATARDPAAILADRPAPVQKPFATGSAGTDPFTYFVQAGAYARTEDADQQRAKLAMMGLQGRTSEREQGGHTVYRVRIGPFERRADAEAAKERLAQAGVEAALVRVQR